MKHLHMKEQKLSRKADIKIKAKLYLKQWKKNMTALKMLSTSVVGFALVVCMVSIIGYQAPGGNTGTIPSESFVSTGVEDIKDTKNIERATKGILQELRRDAYKIRAKNRAYTQKAKRYTQYAHVRTAQIRGKY